MQSAHGIEEFGGYGEAEGAVGGCWGGAGDGVQGYGFEEGEEEVGVGGVVFGVLEEVSWGWNGKRKRRVFGDGQFRWRRLGGGLWSFLP